MIAIDLGSNTIRFIEFDGQRWGESFEKIVKTAESLHATRHIQTNAVERIISAIEEAKTRLDFGQNAVSAVATAAMRMAENRQSILESIQKRTGIAFSVIDGETEAMLTLQAVQYRLEKIGIEHQRFLLIDIGGGSTELILADSGTIQSVSLPIGIVTLSEKSPTEPLLEYELLKFEDELKKFQRDHGLISFETLPLVMTAGTPTTIAAYLHGMDYTTYDPVKLNGTVLNKEGCRKTYIELMGMDEELRTRYVGVGREGLIATGIRIVESVFNAFNITEAIIIDDGLREGVALNYFYPSKTRSLT